MHVFVLFFSLSLPVSLLHTFRKFNKRNIQPRENNYPLSLNCVKSFGNFLKSSQLRPDLSIFSQIKIDFPLWRFGAPDTVFTRYNFFEDLCLPVKDVSRNLYFADTFNEGVARVMKGGAMKNIDRAGKEVKE